MQTIPYWIEHVKTHVYKTVTTLIELQKVSNWLEENRLKLNIGKTKSILFHPVKTTFWKSIKFCVKIGKTIVKMVKSLST